MQRRHVSLGATAMSTTSPKRFQSRVLLGVRLHADYSIATTFADQGQYESEVTVRSST